MEGKGTSQTDKKKKKLVFLPFTISHCHLFRCTRHLTDWRFLASILLPQHLSFASSLPHKQWICLALSSGTSSIAQTTEDDGLDHFQVAFGDRYVAVGSQHLPVCRRISQVSEMPKDKTICDGVRRWQSPKAKGWKKRKK